MTKPQFSCIFYISLALMSADCNAKDTATPPTKPALEAPHKVSAEQIRAALASPDEDSFQTPLGPVLIKHGGGSTRLPGQIFLNGELIYTARSKEENPELADVQEPFSLSDVVGAGQRVPKRRNYSLKRAVIQERNISCQYLVLDFTGPKVWVSERFPKRAAKATACVDITWAEWTKDNIGIFYFGDEYYLWDKEGYHGWTAAYNPKFKRILEPVDAPPPPKYCSLTPKPTNPAFREAGMPKCGDK